MNKINNLTKKQKEELEILRLFNEGETAEKSKEGEFASLFKVAVDDSDIKAGDIVKGSIVEVQTDYVLVDIKYKSEGLIPMSEFRVVEGTDSIQPGDALDFWRVLYANKEEGRLLLFAEMKLPGEAWLEFRISGDSLIQTATFRPLGIAGRLYWYAVTPFHSLIFSGMIKKITSSRS